jgi:uncharacterized protein GlcG (DUF336 family)
MTSVHFRGREGQPQQCQRDPHSGKRCLNSEADLERSRQNTPPRRWGQGWLILITLQGAAGSGGQTVGAAIEDQTQRRGGAMADLDLSQAQQALDAAMKKAAEIDTLMNVALVDAGGNLKAFGRMDGAWLGSIDISIKKARTARFFDMNTGDIGSSSQPGGSLYNIEVSNGGLITFPGGIPLRNGDGEVIGAIGVSGSSVENDHAVADAGAKALG